MKETVETVIGGVLFVAFMAAVPLLLVW